MKQLSKYIQQKLAQKNLSQRDLAQRSSVTEAYISKLIRHGDTINPSIQVLVGLARGFGENLTEMLQDLQVIKTPPPSKVAPPVLRFAGSIEPQLSLLPDTEAQTFNLNQFTIVPLVQGNIAAGPARFISTEYCDDFCIIHNSQIKNRTDLVAIRIDGHSMEPILRHNSIVVIDRQDKSIRTGQIYAVRTEDGPCTVKFVHAEEKSTVGALHAAPEQAPTIILTPANPSYPPQLINLKTTPDPIIGRVIWSWQSYP